MKNWTLRRSDGTLLIDLHPPVFISASLLIGLFVALSIFFTNGLAGGVEHIQAWIANQTGWFFVLTVNIVLGYMVFLGLSAYGEVRLGGPDCRPDFSRPSWFAMLFSAGMGIGLMFYSVAEPMYHLLQPPHGAVAGTLPAYKDAMKTTFLHWGLHAWAIYSLTGLTLAYFAFNRKTPLSIRAIFQPLLGDRIHGFWGNLVDVVATVSTLFGVATSLGLGVTQINAGLNYAFNVPVSASIQVLLIAAITFIATISVVLGLDKGIKRLSTLNMIFAIALLAFVMLRGPTLFILNGFVENIGLYLGDFFNLAFWNETYSQGHWQNGWTVFYWGWWIAWAPFVGIFVARISRGRTIREFIVGVLLVATLMTFFWLSVFGGTALYMELNEIGTVAQAVQDDLASSIYVFLDQLALMGAQPLAETLIITIAIFATLVTICFFVTSSDSGSLVIDIITAGGRPNPPVAQRIYWASMEGVVAAALLLGGGLTALQTAAISVGLPFAVLLLLMIFSLHRALSADHHFESP
ncbi:MAG: hypothetical protein Tsb002_24230 [Wenzhouxiangellaceae bacterium]